MHIIHHFVGVFSAHYCENVRHNLVHVHTMVEAANTPGLFVVKNKVVGF